MITVPFGRNKWLKDIMLENFGLRALQEFVESMESDANVG